MTPSARSSGVRSSRPAGRPSENTWSTSSTDSCAFSSPPASCETSTARRPGSQRPVTAPDRSVRRALVPSASSTSWDGAGVVVPGQDPTLLVDVERAPGSHLEPAGGGALGGVVVAWSMRVTLSRWADVAVMAPRRAPGVRPRDGRA